MNMRLRVFVSFGVMVASAQLAYAQAPTCVTNVGALTWNCTFPAGGGGGAGSWTVSGNDIFSPNSGNVGIGTISPLLKLHIGGDAGMSGRLFIGSDFTNSGTTVKITDNGAPGYGQLQISAATHNNWNGNGNGNNANWIIGVFDDVNGAFSIRSPATGYSAFYATQSGNVGIGTSSPAAKLHVTGSLQVDGNIAAKYQDVAEWVKSRHPIEAGTVVVIGKGDTNIVEASLHSYDTAVVGVVSARPGLTLGDAGDDKVLVAQSGRVLVKVDASYGAVEEGDLLVTSPRPGIAMKSQPLDIGGAAFHRPGTLLGKALQSLPSGEGEILVLLTLQ
jgi:hypothetical protein